MSEQLDDDIRKRISNVFDNYQEDDLAADEGWLLLREKYPEKAKRPIVGVWFWRGMVAAVLLLLCLAGLWLQQRRPQTDQLAGTRNRSKAHAQSPSSRINEKLSGKDNPQQTGNAASSNQSHERSDNQNNGSTIPNTSVPSTREVYAQRKSPSSKNSSELLKPTLPQKQSPANIYAPGQPSITITSVTVDKVVIDKNSITLPQNNTFTDSAANASKTILAQQKPLTATGAKDSAKTFTKKPSMIELLARDQQERSPKFNNNKKQESDKRVIYSVYAATYVNYAKGSSTQPNVGAGFTSDIKLAGNLKLSTGLSIAQNKLNYSGEPTQPSIMLDAVRASSVSSSVQNAPIASAIPLGFAARVTGPAVVVRSYNVSLTGLDLPINLKYEFNPRKTDTYIAAGLSSSTFINETYRYQYDNNVGNALSASSTENIPDASSRTGFNRLDFARTLNVALGMGVQLGSSNRLVIEPFLKYPLDGLGSQQIRFGAGGVNLKLKFQKPKK
ncbi:hypothetical protein [Mucilaginibacter lacusdianchii]|uniref:hypothetical protein n=1 Tax=Mucilaginibacter lacusdianchii TaxID=2684211 RepID=UPI00131BB8CD|nr:hypothetical protein [Mucilaginibacter sp. JXJ CY 39]